VLFLNKLAVERSVRQSRSTILLLVLLCLTVFAQSAALTAQHEEHTQSSHCCLLCHAGPLPFLSSIAEARIAPAFQVVWMAPQADTASPHAARFRSKSPRAPPAA
jgi:uncharacterized protein involved in response to NO